MMSPEMTVPLSDLAEGYAVLRVSDRLAQQGVRQSLSRLGQLHPVVAQEIRGQPLEVLDGFKRLRAARELGWKEMRVAPLAVDAVHAKVAVWTLNDGRGLNALEEGWLIRSLYREDQLKQPQIGQLLGRQKSWVCRRLALAECLDATVASDVRLGLLSASAAEELVRLPRGNQEAAARVAVQRGLTVGQTQRMVTDLLGCPDKAAQQRCLATAPGNEKAAPEKSPSRPEVSDAVQVVMDVMYLSRSAARMQARLKRLALASPPDEGVSWREALVEFEPVLAALSAAVRRVAGGDSDGSLQHA